MTSVENAGKKRVAIAWNDRSQQFFDDLKCLCTTATILAYADITRPFKLHTNACGSGLGTVLYQEALPVSQYAPGAAISPSTKMRD